jgi:hypothetical protein
VGSQEVSKPVMFAVIAVVVVLIGIFGWYYLRPKTDIGTTAPPGMGGQTLPGRAPGPGGPPGSPR